MRAKHGDIEIPVFCYEPKLGAPVGACRMPWSRSRASRNSRLPARHRSATAWSFTPGPTGSRKPRTRSSSSCWSTIRSTVRSVTRAESARSRTSRWAGAPTAAVWLTPKRHFEKPVPLSPLIAIDRERCILCYRCARFSQEVSEDGQLQLLDQGAESYIGTFDDRPSRPSRATSSPSSPGRRPDLLHLPFPGPAPGTSSRAARSAPLPEPLQRQLHDPRRAGEARARS